MQVHVIDHSNANTYAAELDRFYYERHRVYAEELGWVPCSSELRERDQFDTIDATYLLVMDGRTVIGGSRLIPTDRPHLVETVFPHIFSIAPVVRDESVLEWTRGFVVKEYREGGGLALKAQCCAAVMEYCLANGYRQIGGIQDKKWLAIWARMGWRVHVHGDAVDIGAEQWLPAYFDVTPEALAGARKWGRLSGPILVDGRADRRQEVA